MTERSGLPRLARDTLRFLSGLLTISILVQFFIAGMSSVTNPDWWAYHLAWVNIFQWLVLPLPIVAWLGDSSQRCPLRRSRCNMFLCTAHSTAGCRLVSDCMR